MIICLLFIELEKNAKWNVFDIFDVQSLIIISVFGSERQTLISKNGSKDEKKKILNENKSDWLIQYIIHKNAERWFYYVAKKQIRLNTEANDRSASDINQSFFYRLNNNEQRYGTWTQFWMQTILMQFISVFALFG